MGTLSGLDVEVQLILVLNHGGVLCVGERAHARLAQTRHVVRVSAEADLVVVGFDFEGAEVLPHDVPYGSIVVHGD